MEEKIKAFIKIIIIILIIIYIYKFKIIEMAAQQCAAMSICCPLNNYTNLVLLVQIRRINSFFQSEAFA